MEITSQEATENPNPISSENTIETIETPEATETPNLASAETAIEMELNSPPEVANLNEAETNDPISSPQLIKETHVAIEQAELKDTVQDFGDKKQI